MKLLQRETWIVLAGRLGPPIVAASLVGCLLSGHFDLLHGVLIGSGVLLILIHLVYLE
jgi:hypothetical protein